MDSFDTNRKSAYNTSKEKKNNAQRKQNNSEIYGITKPDRYYFPGKIQSACFDENGFNVALKKRNKMDYESLYDCMESYNYDPDGMYTGRPEDQLDRPVQDADDL